MIISNFNVIGEKNNQTSVSAANQETPTIGSVDSAKNKKLHFGIICLPSGWDFLNCIGY